MGTTSIIIPTFNRADLLVDAINSSIYQINADIEIIVIDDGSTDNTYEKVKSFDFPIKYIYQNNAGVCHARNIGLSYSTGEYIVFLDSDDIITPDKVSLQVQVLENNAELDVVYSRWRLTTLDDTLIKDDGADVTRNLFSTLLYTNIAPFHTFVFRKTALEKIGGFDENVPNCEDWDLLLQLALNSCKFDFVPSITAIYRLHEGSRSTAYQSMISGLLHVVDKAFQSRLLPDIYRPYHSLIRNLQYLIIARYRYNSGAINDGQECLIQLLISDPNTANWLTTFIGKPTLKSETLNDMKEIVAKLDVSDISKLIDILIQQIP